MENFSDQCHEIAQVILAHNLSAINLDQGCVAPVTGEASSLHDTGLAILALADTYQFKQSMIFEDGSTRLNLLELAVPLLEQQLQMRFENPRGFGCATLALLIFGRSLDQNPVWLKFNESTQLNFKQAWSTFTFNKNEIEGCVWSAVCAMAAHLWNLGSSRCVDQSLECCLEKIKSRSRLGAGGAYPFVDTAPSEKELGCFDAEGFSWIFILQRCIALYPQVSDQQAYQLNLRTAVEGYVRILPHLVRSDGLGWAYGWGSGVESQLQGINLALYTIANAWVSHDKLGIYHGLLRKLFRFFFTTYVDLEHGYVVVRDTQRNAPTELSTRGANFYAASMLLHWAHLTKDFELPPFVGHRSEPSVARFVTFDRTSTKEQGLFIYRDSQTGLQVQLPLVAPNRSENAGCDYLAFPHCPGIFDWPVQMDMPVMQPLLIFEGGLKILPSFYGKNCTVASTSQGGYSFTYEQPDLVDWQGNIHPGLGAWKVSWTFQKEKIQAQFTFQSKSNRTLESMRCDFPVALPHMIYRCPKTLSYGPSGFRAEVLKNDFQANWLPLQQVSDDPAYRTPYGKIHYVQSLHRQDPMVLQAGRNYVLSICVQLDVVSI